MAALGAPGKPAEGRFFPDTYVYSRASATSRCCARAYDAMQTRLDAAWAERSPTCR